MFKAVITAFVLFASAAYAQGTGTNIGIKPRIADSAVEAFGEYRSPLIFDGFLFINGRYVKPPYSVQYRGNAVMINGILVDRPIRWFGDDSDATAQAAVSSATQQDVVIRNESTPHETAVVEVVSEAKPKPKSAAGSDEFLLFDDEPAQPKAVSAPAPVQAAEPAPAAAKAAGADEFLLFDDEAPKKPAAKPAAEPVTESATVSAPAPTVSSVAIPMDDEARQKIDALMQNKALLKQLRENMLRVAKMYEEYLYYGNFLFVGRTHSRLTGPYLSARTLMEVLPMAMRTSTSGDELKTNLENQNIFFLDLPVCNALYANRLTFLELEDRRKAMQTSVPPPKRK